MSRKLHTDVPGRDFRVYLDEYGHVPSRTRWREIFAPDVVDTTGLAVDIGFGRGEFLIDLARREPGRPFVGIERSFKRTVKMARRLVRLGIANVRLIEERAEEAIHGFFPEASLSEAWINFPDPWPKDRHARRRLVQPAFLRDLTLRIEPGGVLHLATDDPAYASQMAEVLAGEPLLENLYAPETCRRESAGRSPTAYELEWQALGRRGYYFAYRRRPEHLGVGDPA